MNRTTLRTSTGVVLAAWTAALLLSAPPATAACHFVAFVETTVGATESGTATVQVELQGRQPSCGGSVDYATSDGSAMAGQDYTATSGTLTFMVGGTDDRVQTIMIPIVEDQVSESDETFDVTLMNAQGDISVSASKGRATVAIADDDVAPEPEPEPEPEPTPTLIATPTPKPSPEPAASQEPSATPDPTTTDEPTPEPTTPAATESATSEPTPEPVPSPSATPDSDTISLDEVRDGSGGGGFGILVAIVLVVLGGVGALAYRHRTTG